MRHSFISKKFLFFVAKIPMLKFKCIVLGASCVGKTSIINRFCHDIFVNDSDTTIGVDYASKKVVIQDKTITLLIWDTAGQERYKSIIPAYIRDCALALVVFDVSTMKTLEDAKHHVESVRSQRGDEAIIALVGNKIDLLKENEEVDESAKQYADKEGLLYYEVSAKSGTNINSMFKELSKNILNSAGKIEVPAPVIINNDEPQEKSCSC